MPWDSFSWIRIRNTYSGVILLYLVFFSFSCNTDKYKQEENPDYFDPVFSRVDSLGYVDPQGMHTYIEEAFAKFPTTGRLDLFRKYSYLQWYYNEKRHDFPKAMAYADSMLEIMEDRLLQRKYPVMHANSFLAKGDVFRDMKNYNEAYIYFFKAREIIRNTEDICAHHLYSNRLALVYYRQENYAEAAPYFLETFQHLNNCNKQDFSVFYAQQGALDNVALSCHKAGDIAKAIAFYDSTLQFIEIEGAKFQDNAEYRNGINAAKAVVDGNKGGAMLLSGDTLEAERLWRMSIDTNIKGKDEKVDAQLTMGKLLGLYLSSNRLDEAQSVLAEMDSAHRIAPNITTRHQWFRLKWQYYKKTGQLDSAFYALDRYTAMRDSIAAAASIPVVADINKEFEHMTRELQTEILLKEGELKTAYLGILIFLFFTLMGIAWIIWKQWRKSHNHVTELSRLNEEITMQHQDIRKNLSALEQSQASNSRMMKIVAHDLRSPVGAIQSLSKYVLEGIDEKSIDEDQEVTEMLELIHTSSSRAMNLISDLLVLDTSVINLNKELIEMHVVLKYCVDLLQVKATEKKQTINLMAEPVMALACREKLWRVFSNLITNAIKFSAEGKQIDVYLKSYNNKVWVSIKDQGIGIPPSMKGKIFDMVREVKRTGTGGEESFGFGLSICKQIVEAHGGRIWFETEVGQGTTFFVEIDASA